MTSNSNKAKFENLAEEQRKAAVRSNNKEEPTGIKAVIQKHKDYISPPDEKTKWKSDNANGKGEAQVNAYTGKYQKVSGKPTGPPPKKQISDLP